MYKSVFLTDFSLATMATALLIAVKDNDRCNKLDLQCSKYHGLLQACYIMHSLDYYIYFTGET